MNPRGAIAIDHVAPARDVTALYAGRAYDDAPRAISDTHGHVMPPRPAPDRTLGGVASAAFGRSRTCNGAFR